MSKMVDATREVSLLLKELARVREQRDKLLAALKQTTEFAATRSCDCLGCKRMLDLVGRIEGIQNAEAPRG